MTVVPGLDAYPAPLRSLRWTPLGSAGGLSGASLFRGDGDSGPQFALKLWPIQWDDAALARSHRWMRAARAGGCDWVPEFARTTDGGTVAAVGGRLVDVCSWLPGTPALVPGSCHVAAAGAGLALLHRAWRLLGDEDGVAPAIERRAAALVALPAVWRAIGAEAARRLAPWRGARGPIRAVNGDFRAEHVLFTGAAVSGVVDFGAAGFDHPAADLARYSADAGPGAVEGLCAAYTAAGGVTIEPDFVRALAFSGLVVATARWGVLPGEVAARRARDRVDRLAAWGAPLA